MNRTINEMLAKAVADNQCNWDKLLPAFVWSHNTSKHSATGYSSFELDHGHSVRGGVSQAVIGLEREVYYTIS